MITVVIPTLNSEQGLPGALTSLIPAAVAGIVRDVIIVDAGSSDRTLKIAEESGATILHAGGGRGAQLRIGAERAKCQWLLFLHPETELESDWEREAETFMERVDRGARASSAATFRFALDDAGMKPRMLERLAALRFLATRLPYGSQGLLIPRRLYAEVGGFEAIPLMEDVAMARAIGRSRITMLRSRAVSSATSYRQSGYTARSLRSFLCLALYLCRVPPDRLVRIHG